MVSFFLVFTFCFLVLSSYLVVPGVLLYTVHFVYRNMINSVIKES